ncbi:GntR family transcriptional regulator [Aliidongia dinghuensis]|uniref:GntR family transcriptional regulator n=1 Tax=Aliidongia dinghuensis TaxID=1867774 RepID=A0A8J2YQP1_9PROT|nr:GntR family transcriptional regulator [Aliidongia dinghuensis]GGF06329.1 GntR family transcriptional regulator [Aliidongia dinghuensis]
MLDRLHVADTGVPIYVQLREQLLGLIGSGVLRPGAQLPTMRQVAVQLKIDLNTVQRAYGELERDGVLTTMRGRGTFVASAPPPLDPMRRAAETQALAAKTIATARAAGLDPAEIAREILARLNP